MGVGPRLGVIGALVVLVIGLSFAFASSGVIEDDHERNIEVPEFDDLTMDLDLKVAYNDDDIFWRFEWDTETPHYYHDYLVYEDGQWERYGASMVGSNPEGVYEDRLTFLLDDGSVDGFAQYGGYMTILSEEMRFYTDQAPEDEVQAHLGEDDVRKFLPETREDPDDWRTVRSDDELALLQEQGYFLDLWHWRAHRSNPIGWSDDQHVLDYRYGDEGESPYSTNWDEDAETPVLMFDPDQTGQHAMDWDRVLDMGYDQDDYYYLTEEIAVDFDPDHDWQEGDVIPRRLLQEPEGSRGAIFAQGIAQNGQWQLELQRALDTGNPLDDKALAHLGQYDVAFAVHKNATGSRWHHVSFPFTLGLGRAADIEAERFEGDEPPWDDMEWNTVTLFYPGQVGFDHARSDDHAGAEEVRERVHISAGHSEADLALYAVEGEFGDEIRLHWLITGTVLAAFVLMIAGAMVRIAAVGRRVDEDETEEATR